MKAHLTAITFLISIHSYSQQDLTFPVAGATLFKWKDVEKKVPKAVVDKFIKDTPKEFPAYKRNDTEGGFLTLDSLRKDLHFLDLNGDGKEDVIFEGQSDGEAMEVTVFVNTGQRFQKVFSAFQGVAGMDWVNNRLARLYINDWGCCDDYIERHIIYAISYSRTGLPSFKKVFQGVSVYNGTTPDTLLEQPFRFVVLNEGYKIRCVPIIDDTSVQPWDLGNDIKEKGSGSGNCIGELVKGATGTVLAKKRDNTGREWLYVQIDEPYFPKNDIIYVDNKFPTKLIGWISSRYVKVE